MDRRHAALAFAMISIAGCTTTKGRESDPQARRRSIDTAVSRALDDLNREVPGSRELVSRAQGVLVFPNVVSAGLGLGASYGEGALRKRGATTEYYTMGGGSIGLIAGAQSRAVFLLFMTPQALEKFETSRGWTAGVDASVALANVGADVQATTKTLQQPVVGYVLTNGGLMANLSLDGTKINRLEI
jgi:lipid-binding SYLF domain-containing protein